MAVLSTGADIVHIPRVQKALDQHGERFLKRVFTPREVAACRGHASEFAARFAAKEAVSKTLGVGMRIMARNGVGFQDVEVLPDGNGKPHVHLHGRALARAQELGLNEWAVSLTHEREYAIAFVVATG
ncbi:MAG TPA: holo-ACP synthase [Anaerolineae bacterium]|nr:holo-ACP synthase [Anaerolineae bacterium]